MFVIPIYNITALPHAAVYLRRKDFIASARRDPEAGEKVILLYTRTEENQTAFTPESFQKLAVTGRIREEDLNGFVAIDTLDRVGVDDLEVTEEGKIQLSISARPETDDLPDEEEQKMYRSVRQALREFSEGKEWANVAEHLMNYCDNLNGLIAIVSSFFDMPADEKYALLEEDSKRRRAEAIERTILEFIEMAKLANDGTEKREEDFHKQYREAAIKKQIAYLQNELDKLHPENVTALRKLEKAVEDAGMNDEARTEADRVLGRMKNEGENSQEYAMLYDYLEFLTSLPWKKEASASIDLQEAREILERDHFGLKKVKERIIQQIAVLNLKQEQSGSILCFVGAPGTGKTSIGKSIADALHRPYVRVSLGGVRDEADIRGHRRTYIGAMPGRIINGISKAGASNPVMVLDEIDKLSASYNGDPASALLEVLDPEQNHTFTDHYLNAPYDLSDVVFICTANSVDTIPEPLLNRMEVIRFNGYTETEKYEIAVRHLLPRAVEAVGIPADQLTVTEEAMHAIIADYTMEGGVRGLKKRLDTLCRAAAVKLVSGETEKLTVEKDQLRTLLDMRPVRHAVTGENSRPGVVTGLAWTQAGGDVLYIETLFTKGSGKTIITGQLGDVMKESVQIAVSLVKSLYPEKAELFDNNDLHVHVPDGAVPKDGPSAGITLTTALSSLVTGEQVDPHLAMTGEVSLRGVVSPIGGLPEKLMAAKRAGVSKVFIPEDNLDDLEDVAEEIRKDLKIIPVAKVSDVLERIF